MPESKVEGGKTYYRVKGAPPEWVAKEDAEASAAIAERVVWIANEGVRVSRIVDGIAAQAKAGKAKGALIDAFLADASGARPYPNVDPRDSIARPGVAAVGAERLTAPAVKILKTAVRDMQWFDRDGLGYKPNFLGKSIPLPTWKDAATRFGEVAHVKDSPTGELRYQNFSVVMCAPRKLAFFTAVNIDGKRWMNLERGDDKWYFDPRVDLELQVGEDFYGNEPHLVRPKKGWFDRGHLVRRLDPVWGAKAIAELANEDTFHFTNCSPQYFGFNQGETRWQGLENFILDNVDSEDVRATVFTGPLFRDDDQEHRKVQVPQYFWKVVVVQDGDGQRFSSAYAVSQKRYAQNIPFEVLPVGKYRDFHTSIAQIEAKTGLGFAQYLKDIEVVPKPGQKNPFADGG